MLLSKARKYKIIIGIFSYAYFLSLRYLFKDYIEINDNQENILKVIKTTKLLDEKTNKVSIKSNKISKVEIKIKTKNIW